MINLKLEEIIKHVETSLENADNNKSKLNQEILSLQGYSGKKTRHLYNNICSIDAANYLEVGTWLGSSFISSLYNNNIKSIAIDNWSEFGGPKKQFIDNVNRFIKSDYNFIESDCFKVDESQILKIYDSVDIYLYDGNHEFDSHRMGITYFKKLFSKYFILMVDDWRSDNNWKQVIDGTYKGIEESNIEIIKKYERTSLQEADGLNQYWNGVGIFICENKN